MEDKKDRNSFTGSLGFILAAAGSAVGLGNIWRFPYLAAKDGGGLFLVLYIVLALTFGFTLLTTEIAIGRKTGQSALTAYGKIKKGWNFLGVIACLVPAIVLPYYCVIGGWVIKYALAFLTGNGAEAAQDGYFDWFIAGETEPLILTAVFLLMVTVIVFRGVEKGIETSSKILMPVLLLLIIVIAICSVSIRYTDGEGVTRTGLEGLAIYIIPNLEGLTVKSFFTALMDAMGQLFFSLSVSMGIMVAYGSYVRKEANLSAAIHRIEIFDTVAAVLAGVMILPAVYVFMGTEGMAASGPGLMFVVLPKVFYTMGKAGNIMGCLFFAMVLFAAITSGVSVMEAVVSSLMDRFGLSRTKAAALETGVALIGSIFVCLGYNRLYFDIELPGGVHGQLLDVMDYVSNQVLMPLVAIGTCILIGWVAKPGVVIDEVERTGRFAGRRLYVGMIQVIAPILLIILWLKSLGILKVI